MKQAGARRQLPAELLLAVAALGWGLGFPLMKKLVAGQPLLTVLWLRFAIAAAIMLPVLGAGTGRWGWRTVRAGAVLGTLLFLSFVLMIAGLRHTTATNAGFMAGLAVLWVPALATLCSGKPPSPAAAMAVLCALAGIALMSGLDSLTPKSGDSLVILGSVFAALHVLGTDRWSGRHPSGTLALVQMGVIAGLSLGAAAVRGDALFPALDAGQLAALLLTALLSTALAFWIQTRFQRHTTPTRATIIFNLEPVFSALFAAWLLNEAVSARVLLGGAVILVGMSLPTLLQARPTLTRLRPARPRRPRPKPPAPPPASA